VKDDHPAGAQMPGECPEQSACINLEQQHVAADDRIERLLECRIDGITLTKRQVFERPRGSGSARGCDGHWRAIDADNLSSRANQFGRQKANETATAADIQHAHAWRNACSLQIHARTRSDEPVLLKQRDAKGNVLA
jgi:hypothetical protein